MTKKFLALLLAVVMVCAMGIPVSAAETVVWTEVDTASELHAAFATGGNVKLVGDIELANPMSPSVNFAATIEEGKTVTLDLNGHDILVTGVRATNPNAHLYAIDNYGTLTLTDLSSGEAGVITARGIENFGTMIVNNGKIISCDDNGGAAIWNEGELIVNGGTFETAEVTDGVSADPGALYNAEDASAVINGGTFTGKSNLCYPIITEGTLTINNATVSGKHGAVAVEAGLTTIKGGQFTCTSVAAQSDHVIYVGGGKVEIEGGSFTHKGTDSTGSTVVYTDTEGSAKIAGGEFVSENANTSGVSSHGDLVITKGSFNANAKVQIQSGSSAAISGGTFAGKLTVSNTNTSFTVTGGKFEDEDAKELIEDKYLGDNKIENGVVRQKFTAKFKANGQTYTVTYYSGDEAIAEPAVPAKEGYYGYWAAYELNGNITVNAIYVKIVDRSRVSFVADGRLVGIILYRANQDELTVLPKVPAKEGYVGTWAEYTLTGKNMIVRAVYTPIAE